MVVVMAMLTDSQQMMSVKAPVERKLRRHKKVNFCVDFSFNKTCSQCECENNCSKLYVVA